MSVDRLGTVSRKRLKKTGSGFMERTDPVMDNVLLTLHHFNFCKSHDSSPRIILQTQIHKIRMA